MAHRGKTYPVHFRRDLHANLPNNHGWPDKIQVVAVIGLNNGFLGPTQPVPWPSMSGVFIGGVELRWDSAPIVAHGANWFWRLKQTNFWTPSQTSDRVYQVFRNGVITWERTFNWTSQPFYDSYDSAFVSTVTVNGLGALGITAPLPETFSPVPY